MIENVFIFFYRNVLKILFDSKFLMFLFSKCYKKFLVFAFLMKDRNNYDTNFYFYFEKRNINQKPKTKNKNKK